MNESGRNKWVYEDKPREMRVHALEFKRANVFDVSGLTRTEERNDDRQAHCNFSSRNRDDEEDENLCVVIGQSSRAHIESAKSYERKVRRVEHQLQAHENSEDVPAKEDPSETDGEEESTCEKIMVEGKAHWVCRDGLLQLPARKDDHPDRGD